MKKADIVKADRGTPGLKVQLAIQSIGEAAEYALCVEGSKDAIKLAVRTHPYWLTFCAGVRDGLVQDGWLKDFPELSALVLKLAREESP